MNDGISLPPVFPYQSVKFVTEGQQKTHTKTRRNLLKAENVANGLEVKAFYEDLVGGSNNKTVQLNSSCTDFKESDNNNGIQCPAPPQSQGGVGRQQQHNSGISQRNKRKLLAYGPNNIISRVKKCKNTNWEQRKKYNHFKSSKKSIISVQRVNHQFLRYAQDGNIDEIDSLIRNDCDLNFKDQYGWTALMCASFAGQKSVVKLLLQNGSDINLTNNRQQTAEDLAAQAGRFNIVDLIREHMYSITHSTPQSDLCNLRMEAKYCDKCKTLYVSEKCTHDVSTVHQINTNDNPTDRTQYGIPESNKGFQIMLKSGWDKHHGLGLEGQKGQKFPVKTELKKDRKGLGLEKRKLRVTHFKPNDFAAVESQPNAIVKLLKDKQLNKKNREKLNRKRRQKEINFRNEFNSGY